MCIFFFWKEGYSFLYVYLVVFQILELDKSEYEDLCGLKRVIYIDQFLSVQDMRFQGRIYIVFKIQFIFIVILLVRCLLLGLNV